MLYVLPNSIDLLPWLHSAYDSLGQGRKWFDCAECHAEQEAHALLQTLELVRCPAL